MLTRSPLADAYIEAPSHGGAYAAGQPKVIVIHCLVSPIRAGLARELAGGWMQTAGVSVHYIVDPAETIQTLDEGIVAWGAGTVNSCALHIEQGGYAVWTRDDWLTPDGRRQLKRVAALVADIAARHGIPLRWCTDDQLRDAYHGRGQGGLTTHRQCRDVIGGTTHWDPGDGYPTDLLLSEAIAASAPAGRPTSIYTVRPGDTLSEIAATHGTTVAALAALNNIPDPDRIRVGQVIRLTTKEAPVIEQTPQERYDELADEYGISKAAFGHLRTAFAKVVDATNEGDTRRALVDFLEMFDGKTYTVDNWLHLLRAQLNVEES